MDKDPNFIIVIGRQFGSGGRTIGKLLASRLGIDYYDTELLKKAAESEGVSPLVFKDHEEKRPSVLKVLLQGAYGIADNFHTVPLSSERIYRLQNKIIKDIAEKGSCVIVGRNADFILRDNPKVLSVFLHSPLETRAKRIVERGEAKDIEEACEIARHHDRRRESYYNFYTGEKKWGLASNYHISLDTSYLNNEEVAAIIINLAKNKLIMPEEKENNNNKTQK
ncbi:MAG: cytidylate kinase-like family protein [Muribaculaceae bacterium]|nr:cytidylate kinase-like family protein [Muribaculaceae bacterium]